MVVVEVVAFVLGAAVVVSVGLSAVRTVVLPRARPSRITRLLFTNVRRIFDLRARVADSYEDRDRIMALYAPLCLVLLAGVWVLMVAGGFAAMYWATGSRTWADALAVSGSGITTLGMDHPAGYTDSGLAVVEAVIGLGLVALLISYLPSIYSSFQRRELAVALLEVRAGDPPTPGHLLERVNRIGSLEEMQPFFRDWEAWFADIEETHTTLAALCFFRSPLPGRSWVTAAGAVLDTASLLQSTVETGDLYPEASLCIRAGFLSLRRIADGFTISFNADPAPTDPISIDRGEYDEVCEQLAAAGVPLRADREQAWSDFQGWRVNYDRVLIGLAALTMAPYAPWSSDRLPRK